MANDEAWAKLPQDVQENYEQLYREGRDWSTMADEAARMGDKTLAAALRSKDAGESKDPAPVTKAPQGRSSKSGAQTNG